MFLNRLLISFFVFLLVIVLAIYLLIPTTISVQNVSRVKCTPVGANRIISDWKNAFTIHTDTSFFLNGFNFSMAKRFSNGADFLISSREQIYATNISLLPYSIDTSVLIWTASSKTGNNPITRAATYFKLTSLKKTMNEAANKITSYLADDSNIYNYRIHYTTLTDTFLISIKYTFPIYPSTNDIYKLVNQLKSYAKNNGALETNYPMLNLITTDNNFTVMVGLPINKSLPAFGNIQPKRLSPMRDKILTTEIYGGESTVQDAYKQIEFYMQDHSLTSPVIPFEFLITDRSNEPDTSKWYTAIYYPII